MLHPLPLLLPPSASALTLEPPPELPPLLDKAAVTRMLDEHRAGPIDHSRRLWTLLVFMIWHGIFVEKRIVPQIQEPAYPVEI